MGPLRPKKKGNKKMNNSLKIKRLVGLAALIAIVVVLQLVSSVIKFGPFSITLSLIPLVVGAVIYGPVGGGILGVTMGLVVLVSGDAQAFFVVNPFATVLLVLLKSGLAGVGSGFIYLGLKKLNKVFGVTVAAIMAPIINTGIFALGCILFFMPTLKEWASGSDALSYLFIGMIGVNFLVELAVNTVLSPVIYYIVNTVLTNFNIGQKREEKEC